jgi:hypothetical protein
MGWPRTEHSREAEAEGSRNSRTSAGRIFLRRAITMSLLLSLQKLDLVLL